jgi:translation initiation factor IF-2
MKISKQDALIWFDFFSQMSEEEEVSVKHEEIIYATFAQIEAAIARQRGRSFFVIILL